MLKAGVYVADQLLCPAIIGVRMRAIVRGICTRSSITASTTNTCHLTVHIADHASLKGRVYMALQQAKPISYPMTNSDHILHKKLAL